MKQTVSGDANAAQRTRLGEAGCKASKCTVKPNFTFEQ